MSGTRPYETRWFCYEGDIIEDVLVSESSPRFHSSSPCELTLRTTTQPPGKLLQQLLLYTNDLTLSAPADRSEVDEDTVPDYRLRRSSYGLSFHDHDAAVEAQDYIRILNDNVLEGWIPSVQVVGPFRCLHILA